ncbi:hypothetical protein Hneap_1536 [Halothiobacillus neapolitanus c2]|uniref:PIN domain-containing protein n=1 Tax=Halothiobacillus neapolitanus (strain ATCC 23641 / DSM 15147 / CIP 104769 / NCIMB 8539 / c2) TaxID=555778 RepID=D0L0Z3_HALNC|nr:hypothetical protein Hneap_1536 [Halothiobacillus neapolitanus c2]TDN66681.1 uncharacterized protein DUF2492 [Halothiobacillus neapolitanus]
MLTAKPLSFPVLEAEKLSSIVIDTCVIRLYDAPLDPKYCELFNWINTEGTLYISQKLLNEYVSTKNRNIDILLAMLVKNEEKIRIVRISKNQINTFKIDKNFNYTCNNEDIDHSRLVFLSPRKKLISQDLKLISDINRFKKVDGIKPSATKHPDPAFYK